jgi:signal transduction histidine kinase
LEKLATLGTLSAGIAHEINTPLQMVTGLSERHIKRIEDGRLEEARIQKDLLSINQNGWRIVNIVRSLLTYARPKMDEVGVHDLNEIIADTLLLIEHRLRSWSNIYVIRQFAEDLPQIRCERNSISQLLINILTNASDAMPQGGEIAIQTDFGNDRRQFMLRVSDTGVGIPEDIRSKVFDPFFTIRRVGEGTGLGLSIVWSVVQAHGGEVELESDLGQGTTITLWFPEKPKLSLRNGKLNDGLGRYYNDERQLHKALPLRIRIFR